MIKIQAPNKFQISIPNPKNFHAKAQNRKGIAKKNLYVFFAACALRDALLGSGSSCF